MIKLTFREIRKSLTRYLAILSIVALGVGFYAGLKMCKPDMVATCRDYIDENNLYDFELMSSYGIDEESIRIAEESGKVVQVEGSIQQDIVISTESAKERVIKAISLPANINNVSIVSGRLPQKSNECVIDSHQFTDGDFHIGKTIKVAKTNAKKDRKQFEVKKFIIVGAVSSPVYLDFERGTTTLGDGKIAAFAYMPKSSFNSDVYTQMYAKMRVSGQSFSDEYDDSIESAEDSMEDLAEKINVARFHSVRQDAQEKLDEKKSEYQDGVDEYNSEKTKAEKKIGNAEAKLNSGEKQLKEKKKELKSTIQDLNNNKKQLENGISQAEQGLTSLEEAYKAGMIDDENYEIQKETITSQLTELQENFSMLEAGLVQANNGFSEIERQERIISKNRKKLEKEKSKADAEFAKAKAKLEDAYIKLQDGQEKIDDLDEGKSYSLTRESNVGYATFEENVEIVSNVAKIFPLFFFMIAALVCMTTMTRMIDEHRSQIGVLKALGYSNASILGMYMTYSGSAAFIGSIIGLVVGCNVFPSVIWHAYTMMYDFRETLEIMIHTDLAVVCILTSLVCCMGATWISCASDFKVVPAELIRPKTPKAGKRILLERIKPIWDRLSFLYKVSFRNIFRYKKRFFMMVIGVSGCTALLIAGLGINTTIKGVARNQYENVMLYDYQIAFDTNMNADKQENFINFAKKKDVQPEDILFVHSGNVDLSYEGSVHNVSLTATDDKRITNFVHFTDKDKDLKYPGKGEVAICRKLQKQCGIDVGDEVVLKDGYNKMTAKVSAIFDNYMMEPIYMTERTYIEGMGEKPDVKTALFMAPENTSLEKLRDLSTKLGKYKHALQASVNQDSVERVDDMMSSLNAVVYVVILCAGLLAFIVLYNLTNINITERIREIATIKVLGFNAYETSRYVFRENVFLTLISAIVGIPLGKWLLYFVIDNININMIFFVPRITTMDYALAVVLTFVFAFVVDLAMRGRLAKVSMTESLKSVE